MDYHEFRSQYEAQHQASVPVLRYELAAFPAWVRWAVMAMFMRIPGEMASMSVCWRPDVAERLVTGIETVMPFGPGLQLTTLARSKLRVWRSPVKITRLVV